MRYGDQDAFPRRVTVRQSSTGHAATHDMQPVHSGVHTDGFSWTRISTGHARVHALQSMHAAASRTTRFAQARGYRLEQVNRYSRIAFPVAGVQEQLAAAIERSGPDYRLHSWLGSTPERWLEDLAVLITRMSTDAPDAGVGTPEDVWTAERLAAENARKERDDPRRFVTTAVEHVPTGKLVGFTEYSIPPDTGRAASQYATLVLSEHRGHKLGMLLKIANLAYLEQVAPGYPSATTWNAEENRPMLDVNEAIGFVGIAFEGIWRKDL